jgi:hypothetical protein
MSCDVAGVLVGVDETGVLGCVFVSERSWHPLFS